MRRYDATSLDKLIVLIGGMVDCLTMAQAAAPEYRDKYRFKIGEVIDTWDMAKSDLKDLARSLILNPVVCPEPNMEYGHGCQIKKGVEG